MIRLNKSYAKESLQTFSKAIRGLDTLVKLLVVASQNY